MDEVTGAHPKPKTPRSRAYLEWVRQRHCCACGSTPPSQAAHVRFGNGGGIAMKPSDYRTVPLCATCHGEQHRIGEPQFWLRLQRMPDTICSTLLAKFAGERGYAKVVLGAIETAMVELAL